MLITFLLNMNFNGKITEHFPQPLLVKKYNRLERQKKRIIYSIAVMYKNQLQNKITELKGRKFPSICRQEKSFSLALC